MLGEKSETIRQCIINTREIQAIRFANESGMYCQKKNKKAIRIQTNGFFIKK